MPLRVFNTLTRTKEEFVPGDPNRVTLYVCGPTVYNRPHIGNARPAVVFDVLARYLRSHYPEVIYARNITDVDDKINAEALERQVPISVVAGENIQAYHEDIYGLGVLPPDVEPFATEHVDDMVAMISRLIDDGYAYAAEGHVLFRVNAFEAYGELSRRDTRQLVDGARVEVAPYKEEAGDFVLWKPSTDELPGWDSPWGRGRPGWHIECSAMAARYLGPTIDIHGGGHDLIFPHHENELAQSRCAHDAPLARYWMHNGFVNIDHTKMSKSLGNVVLVSELLKQAHAETIRTALLTAHYRQPLDWAGPVLGEAKKKLDRLYTALRDADGWQENWQQAESDAAFVEALEDDLNTPRALAALFELGRAINRSDDAGEKQRLAAVLRRSAEVLGILGEDPESWFREEGVGGLDPDAIDALLVDRGIARERRDFAEADRIRDLLSAEGILIEDGPNGARWRRSGDPDE